MRLSVFVLLVGCTQPSTTSMLLELETADGQPVSASLSVSLYSSEGAVMLEHVLEEGSLPGRMVLLLPERDDEFRVIVRAQPMGLIGWVRKRSVVGAQISAKLTLGSSMADNDADGVPDGIDVCNAFDPEQTDSDGNGVGDACERTVEVDMRPPSDIDPPNSDLANADLLPACAGLCPAGAVCIDGESTPLPNNNIGGGGNVVRDTTQAHCGTGSYHATVDGKGGDMGTTANAALTGGSLPSETHLRAFFWLPSSVDTATEDAQLFKVGSAGGVYLTVSVLDGALRLNRNSLNIAQTVAASAFPRDRWVCVEFVVQQDQVAGSAQVLVDGQEALVQTGQTRTASALGYWHAGLWVYNPPPSYPAQSLWIDDIAISSSAIGCGP